MAKETFYFPHDYNARNDEKILELRSAFGLEGYGVFWMLIETMAENANGGVKASLIGGLSLGYGIAKERLHEIITFCLSVGLLYEEDGFYFSKRLLEHKAFRKNLSDKGKEGAEKRWKNKDGNSPPIATPNGDGNAKESKGKESNTVTSTYNPQIEEKPAQFGIVHDMIRVWKEFNPKYLIEQEQDFPACLRIAYKIAKMKGWKKEDVVSDKRVMAVKSWETIVAFVKEHTHYRKLELYKIENQFSGLAQTMDAERDEKDKKERLEQEKLKKLTTTAMLIPQFSQADYDKYD